MLVTYIAEQELQIVFEKKETEFIICMTQETLIALCLLEVIFLSWNRINPPAERQLALPFY